MIKAFLRLLVISTFAVIGTATLVAFLRMMGLSRPYQAMEHKLNNFNNWVIVKNQKKAKNPSKTTAYLSYVELTDSVKELSLLSNKQFYWLFVNTNKQVDLDRLINFLKNSELEERVVISGPFKKSIDYIQKKHPRLLFTADPIILDQLTIMESIFLEPFAPMRFDTVLVNTQKAKKQISPTLIKEFLRRQIRVVFDLKEPKDPWFLKNKQSIKGIMTTRPDIL